MHLSLLNKLERCLVKLVISCIVVLVSIQIIMLHEDLRHLFSQIDHVEGQPLFARQGHDGEPLWYTVIEKRFTAASLLTNQRKSESVILRMIKPKSSDKAWVTVNGEKAGDFRYGETSVTVYEGDYLEINCDGLNSPTQFIVTVPQQDLVTPSDGIVLEGTASVITVGKVKFK
jgi:hypothetical protein